MTGLEIIIGSGRDYPLQCWNQGAQTAPTDWAATDTLSAYVYRGQDQTLLFAVTVGWYTANATQTGYGQAQVLATLTAVQSATLDPNGTYIVIVWRTPTGSADTKAVWRGTLTAVPAAGAATQAVGAYCSYEDMLGYAPWIRIIQDSNIDQEGFYSQRLQARQWFDNLIVKNWRGGAWAMFGDASRPASEWSGWGIWRTPLTSPYLRDMLTGGFVRPSGAVTITAAGTGYTSITVTAPDPPNVGKASQPGGLLARPATFTATLNGVGGLGSIVVGDPGLGYAPGTTITLTVTGDGTGATATAAVSAGTLINYPNITRLNAWRSIYLVGQAQIGTNNQFANYAQYFADMLSAELQSTVAELDINGDGLADIAVPLGRTNTIYE